MITTRRCFPGPCICSGQREDMQSKGQIAKSHKYWLMLKCIQIHQQSRSIVGLKTESPSWIHLFGIFEYIALCFPWGTRWENVRASDEESEPNSGCVINQEVGLTCNDPYTLPLTWQKTKSKKEKGRCWNAQAQNLPKKLFCDVIFQNSR